jgi:hypothetical protein
MTAVATQVATEKLPTHLDLPETDGSMVTNFREHPQSMLLTGSILPILRRIHPDGHFAIGQDSLIYWKFTDPPLRGSKAPDWYYVSVVPPTPEGNYRRSFVMWQEKVPPHVILEFASDDGSEERDQTPEQGKFWVYENGIRAEFYGIFIVARGELEMYRLINGSYNRLEPNERGHYPISGLGVELGVVRYYYVNETAPWLRWFESDGRLLMTGDERAEIADARADEQARRADEQTRRADEQARLTEALAKRLRDLGVDPDSIAPRA